MYIEKLYLKNFLSYDEAFVEFFDGLNVIEGKNASGKTNMLDSVYLSAIGKTSRGTRDKDIIRWDADGGARVRLLAQKKYGRRSIDVYINDSGQKCISLDSLPISKIGELMGGITAVLFSPDEMKLIKESPSERRRFLDISLSQQSKIYFYELTKYNKLLAQRNKLLKEYKSSKSLSDMLELVEEQLLPTVEYIVSKRRAFTGQLDEIANTVHQDLTGSGEELRLCYETEQLDFSDIKDSMRKLYRKSREKDMRLEYTTAGIHRDDIKILAGGIDIRKFGSQGQQRTAVLAMKLAECRLHLETGGEYPVLLLDDVLSELDLSRQQALLRAVQGIQTIVTCTEFSDGLTEKPYKLIKIGKNKIIETEIKQQ